MLDIVIPAAGQGYRMKAIGPKGLISLGEETVLLRQIRLLKTAFPDARIVVVGGFGHAKLHKSIPPNLVSFVVNNRYADTNVAYSIQVGLQFTKPANPVLIVYGDLVFTPEALVGLNPAESSVVVDDQPGRERQDEVGVAVVDGHVTRFSFGMPLRWAQIMMLTAEDKALFFREAGLPHRSRFFGYEILNELLKQGRRIKAVVPDDLRLVEIDSTGDIDHARTMLTGQAV